MCKTDSWWEASALSDDLGAWDGRREGGSRRSLLYICIYVNIHICIIMACVVQQKPTQHCKAVFLQLKNKFKKEGRASLVAQWWRIRQPMQETWAWSLVWEDPTCPGAAELCVTAAELCSRAPEPQLLKPANLQLRLTAEKPQQWGACVPQLASTPSRLY